MVLRRVRSALLGGLALAGSLGAVVAAGPQASRPLAIDTARVTIAGPSNIHAYMERQADPIVLGVHGWNAFDCLVFGSTTEHIVRRATCPSSPSRL